MLVNDIGYDIYYGGGDHERPMPRRQSWPKNSGPAATNEGAGLSLRRFVGRGLIGLGRVIAAEPTVAAKPRMASNAR